MLFSCLSPNNALDVLHVTGHSDEGGGYLQLRDNKRLRSQARSLIAGAGRRDRVLAAAAVERDEPAGSERADHGALFEGGVRRSSDGRPVARREGFLGAERGWWSKDRRMCHVPHEVIDEPVQKKKKAGERNRG